MALSLVQLKQDLELTRPTFDQMNLNELDFNKELEWAVQIFTGNTYLLSLNAETVRNSLVNLSMTGLTLNPILKLAYLVPRKGKCCVDVSYMGLIKILTDSGSVQSIKAKPVFSNEPFEIELGTNGYVKHSICKSGTIGHRIGCYSIAVLNDGSNHVEWMYEYQLQAIKQRSESVKSGKASPWLTDEDEMIRKTVVKRHYKYLPKSDRAIMAAQAIAFDDDNNGIDFEQEAKDKARKAKPEANHTFQDAMATDEDYGIIFGLINQFLVMGIVNFNSNPPLPVNSMKAKLESDLASGQTLPKSKAEEYIEWLKKQREFFTTQQQ